MNSVKIKKFNNGSTLIFIPKKNSLSSIVSVFVKTGSEYETKELNGISHFLEHMLFKGTKKRKEPLDILSFADEIGAVFNAATSNQYTFYYVKSPSHNFTKAFDLVSDIYLNSVFPEEELERERNVIFEEIKMRFDTPMVDVVDLFTTCLYGDQPAGWDIAGTPESVSKIKRSDLINYMESQYKASNTIVVAAGNIKEKDVLANFSKYFKNLKEGKPKEKSKVIIRKDGPKILLQKRNTDQVHLALGGHGFPITAKERFAQDLITTILGVMGSSRLFLRIREEMGAAYYVGTDSDFYTDHGYIYSQVGTNMELTEKVIKEIVANYKYLTEKPVPAKELKKAKGFLEGKTMLSLESLDALAGFYGVQYCLKESVFTPKKLVEIINKITPRDIILTARKIFTPINTYLAMIGPFEKEKEKVFLKLLKYE